jgi:hypothetical protein
MKPKVALPQSSFDELLSLELDKSNVHEQFNSIQFETIKLNLHKLYA